MSSLRFFSKLTATGLVIASFMLGCVPPGPSGDPTVSPDVNAPTDGSGATVPRAPLPTDPITISANRSFVVSGLNPGAGQGLTLQISVPEDVDPSFLIARIGEVRDDNGNLLWQPSAAGDVAPAQYGTIGEIRDDLTVLYTPPDLVLETIKVVVTLSALEPVDAADNALGVAGEFVITTFTITVLPPSGALTVLASAFPGSITVDGNGGPDAATTTLRAEISGGAFIPGDLYSVTWTVNGVALTAAGTSEVVGLEDTDFDTVEDTIVSEREVTAGELAALAGTGQLIANVTARDADGAEVNDVVYITVNPALAVTAQMTPEIFVGDGELRTIVTAVATGGAGGYRYQWTSDPVIAGLLDGVETTASEITFRALDAAEEQVSFTVVVTDSAGNTSTATARRGGGDPADPPAEIPDGLVVSIANPASCVVVGGTLALDGTAEGGVAPLSFTWTGACGTFAAATSEDTAWTAPLTAQTCAMTLTAKDKNGLTKSQTIAVKVARPTVQFVEASSITEVEALVAADADGHNVSVVLGLPEGCALQTPVIVQLVDLATGSAMAGADYAALAVDASVTFPVGAVNGDVQTAGIVVTDDALVEGSETIILGLGTVSGNGVAGSTRKHTITVTDDDLPMLTLADVAQVEGHAGTSTMVFRLTLDQPSYLPVTVQYETLDGDDVDPTENATGGSDFAVKAGTVSLQAGETEVEVLVTVSGDTVVEKDESFYLHLLNVVNATAAPADLMRQGLIINDDGTVPALVLVPTVLNLVEGGIATYDVSFNAAGSVPTGPVTVVMDFDDAQVTVVPATLTFTDADWTTPQTVTVQAISDGIAEGAHQAGIAHLVSSTDPAYNGLAAGDVRVKIAETDVANVLVTAPTGAATEGGATATYDISLVTMPTSDVTITLAADGQSTVNPTVLVFTSLDYATPQTVEVTAVDDALIEGAHQSIITHTASSADPSYNNVVVASATVDIVDNDISTLSLSNPQDVPEGDSGTSLVIFTVTMSPASEQIVTVNYAALDGLSPNPAKNAKLADNDYEFASGMLTFLPGQTTQQILVRINGDTKVEDDERFLLALLTPTNAVLGIALQNITIVNDDAPRITIESVRVDETAGVATLEVEIDKPIATNVGALTVNYTTQDGTAVNGEDYTTTTGQVTFPADGTTQTATINVPITNDTITCEGDEQFTVKLTGSSSGSIVEDTGTVIIADDDAGASLAIDDVSAGEGGIATFTITLTGSCDQPITVAWTTSPGTADASDFTPASAVVTFPAGSPSGSTVAVAITTTADSMHEGDETFFVNLTNPTHATVTDSQGTGTITDDDAAPTLSVSDVTVEEGDAGEVQAVFTVTLTAASGNTVTVNADTADDSATSPADYTPVSQALSFPPGETVRTVMVPVKGDRLFEDAETFKLVLSGNPDIADAEGVCTIALSDVPTITIDAAVAVAEGSAPPAQTDAIFVVRLSNPIAASHAAITLTFATEDGTATAADGDYVAVSTTVTFPNDEGTTVATLADTTVKIEQDITDESNETFNVHITGASAGTIVPGADTRSGTIVNDDGAPQVIATPALVNEPDAGDPPASLDFTVQVVGATSNTVVVNYLTSNNSAEADQDYNAVAGTLFFAPGGPAQTVSVAVLGDDMFELNETFFLVLTSAVNALVATPQVPGAILNNDPEPMLSLSPGVAMVNEANSGTTDALFAVNLDRPSSLPITVNFQTISGLGSATSGVDYLPTQGQVTFPPGSIDTQFFIVPIVGDTLDEGNENFLTTLYQATNALIASPTYITIIVDNDP